MITATKSIRNTGVIYSVSGSGVEVGDSLISGSGYISCINFSPQKITIGSPSSTAAKINIDAGNNSSNYAMWIENSTTNASVGEMIYMKYTGDTTLDSSGIYNFGSGASFITFADSDNVLAKIKATSATLADIVQPSDYRLKKNVEDYSGSLDIIKRLQPKKFVWEKSNEHDVGFIAHEIKEVVPEGIVFGDKDGDEYQMVRYNGFIVYLVGAIKEQQQLIEDLRSDVDELKSK
jgi:hypothetical protein